MPTQLPSSVNHNSVNHKNDDQPVKPFYRQLWFWILMLPLMTSVILSSIMVKTAFQLGDDVVVGEYYKEGRMLNDRLQSNQAAEAAGLAANVRFDLDVGEILITLTRNDSVELPETMTLFLDHPMTESKDRQLPLMKITENYYRAELKKGLQHRWYLRLEPTGKEGSKFWRLSGEINVNKATEVRLLPKS